MDGMTFYFSHLKELLDNIQNTQAEAIESAADCFFTTMMDGGRLFAFGCTHAGMITQEMFYRTGGMAIVNPIFPPGLNCEVSPITLSSQMERLPEYGRHIAQKSGLKEGDALLIHSVSGRNTVGVDMALEARAMGVKTIALTNLNYSNAVTSRHPSGKRLFEVCDIVIDNCGCYGDASVRLDGFPEAVASTSTITGSAIVNALAIKVLEKCIAANYPPPFFVSSNTDRGDAYNKALFERFKDQILYT